MSKVSRDDVLYLAALSNLQLDESDIESLQNDLTKILDYVEKLDELDTSGVKPTYQVTDLENVWREDKVDNYGFSRGELLKLAPEASGNQVKVPKVL